MAHCICLDPKDLNKAIIREYHKSPTLEEGRHKLAGAKYISKMDPKNGFWSIHLDEPYKLLNTSNTTLGHFNFNQMPFRLCISQDVYQIKMDK